MRVVDFGRFVFLAGVATVLAACGGGSSPLTLPNSLYVQQHSGSSPIKHIVIIVQENRSFNNFFAGFPGANGTMRGKEKIRKGGKWVDKWVALKEQPLVPSPNHDIGHCYYSFVKAYDGGKMDGFNYEPEGACQRNWSGGPG
ncbi:MAG: alkaline phosphatase family protein, partial [Candidatus Cybelea sp.]